MANTNQTTKQMTAGQAVKAGKGFDRILAARWGKVRVTRRLKMARLQYLEYVEYLANVLTSSEEAA